MPTEVIIVTTQNSLCQEYDVEWKINNLSCMKPKGIRTPVFSPLSNIDVKFCIDIGYQKNTSRKFRDEFASFKVLLVKLPTSKIQPSLKLEFNVTANYTDGTLLKEYKSLSEIEVSIMNSVMCINDSYRFYNNAGNRDAHLSVHGSAMRNSDALILKLRMKFYGHLSTPSVYCREMRSLNNLKKFAEDFNALMQPSTLSDLTILIGGKDLPAHKAILAAHSPVFMKMMTSDFLEPKTNIIAISDFSFDIFECFMKYLYSGEIKDKSWSNVRELFILADKYDVETLKKECAEIIGSFLTVDQVYDILMIAYDYNDSDLKEKAKCFAVKHFHKIFRTVEWNALVASHPIIGYEVLASLHVVPKNVLKNKEPVTLVSDSNEIFPVEK